MTKTSGLNSNAGILKNWLRKKELVNPMLTKAKEGSSITLLYGTKGDRFNNAVQKRP